MRSSRQVAAAVVAELGDPSVRVRLAPSSGCRSAPTSCGSSSRAAPRSAAGCRCRSGRRACRSRARPGPSSSTRAREIGVPQVVGELRADREPRGRVLDDLPHPLPLLLEEEPSPRRCPRRGAGRSRRSRRTPAGSRWGRSLRRAGAPCERSPADGGPPAAAGNGEVAVALDARLGRRDLGAGQVLAAAGGLHEVAAGVVLVVDDEAEGRDLGADDPVEPVDRAGTCR